MTVEEFKTLREVGIAIGGVKSQLSLYAAVFAGVVAVAAGAYGVMFVKVDNLEDATARIETRLSAVETTLQTISAKLDKIDGSTQRTQADVSEIRKADVSPNQLPFSPNAGAFVGWAGVQVTEPSEAAAFTEKFQASINAAKPAWLFVPEQ